MAFVLPAFAQLEQGGPVSSFEYELVRGMTDSVIMLVRQEYNLRSSSQEYVLGDQGYFGGSYSIGVFAEGKMWVEDSALAPWANDPAYAPYAGRDSLVPVLKKTFIRPLSDSVFHQVTMSQVDSLPGEMSGLALGSFPFKLGKVNLVDSVQWGWAVVVYPEMSLDSSQKSPLRVQVIYSEAKRNPQTGEILLSSGTAVLNAMGGAFFTSEVSAGMVRLRFAGLLKRKLLRFQVLPFPQKNAAMVVPPAGNVPAFEPPPPPPPQMPVEDKRRSLNTTPVEQAVPKKEPEQEEGKRKRKRKNEGG